MYKLLFISEGLGHQFRQLKYTIKTEAFLSVSLGTSLKAMGCSVLPT